LCCGAQFFPKIGAKSVERTTAAVTFSLLTLIVSFRSWNFTRTHTQPSAISHPRLAQYCRLSEFTSEELSALLCWFVSVEGKYLHSRIQPGGILVGAASFSLSSSTHQASPLPEALEAKTSFKHNQVQGASVAVGTAETKISVGSPSVPCSGGLLQACFPTQKPPGCFSCY